MKNMFLLFLFVFLSHAVSAQQYNPQWDDLGLTPGPYALSRVIVKDLRVDSSALVSLKTKNKKKEEGVPFYQAMGQLYQGLSATTGTPNDLLILLHHFYIYNGKKNYLRFKADYLLGSQEKDSFRLMSSIDTLIKIKGLRPLRATAKILHQLYQDMVPAGSPSALTCAQAIQMDIAAKQKWPAFSTTWPENAVYTTWEDFLTLQAKPERTIIPDGTGFKIEYINSKGNKSLAPVSYCKVFSCKSNLFFVTEMGKLPMQRKGADFYVSSEQDLMAPGVSVLPYSYGMGAGVGIMIPISGGRKESVYEYKVDSKRGALIPVK